MKTDISTFKPSELFATLNAIAPAICIETIWEHDEDARWDIEDNTLDPDDFTAWQSEVRASVILDGKLVSESAYMSGTWEKYGDDPRKSNPEISGYLPQMIQEALRELLKRTTNPGQVAQIQAALNVI